MVESPNLSSFIWAVADLLRGDFKQSEYGRVILPFTVLRRLDCVLEPTKKAVLAEREARKKAGLNPEPFLLKKARQLFYNTSPLDLKTLMGDPDHIGENLRRYVQELLPAVREIFERFDFHTQIERLDKAKLLYLVTEKFANIDLHPDVVTNAQMGGVFEELIRQLRRAVERDRRRALHPARGDPPDGEPPLHRGRRRPHPAGRRPLDLRPHRRHRRHAQRRRRAPASRTRAPGW